jgi:hypothetical protein
MASSVTKINQLIIFRKIIAIYSETKLTTQMHSVGKMLNCLTLKQTVQITNTVLQSYIRDSGE